MIKDHSKSPLTASYAGREGFGSRSKSHGRRMEVLSHIKGWCTALIRMGVRVRVEFIQVVTHRISDRQLLPAITTLT